MTDRPAIATLQPENTAVVPVRDLNVATLALTELMQFAQQERQDFYNSVSTSDGHVPDPFDASHLLRLDRMIDNGQLALRKLRELVK